MTPILIGYFPKRTVGRSTGLIPHCPDIDELANVAGGYGDPEKWVDLWFHNEIWFYDTELQAWAVATDLPNLQRLNKQLSDAWDGVTGSVQKALNQYVIKHTLPPGLTVIGSENQAGWDLYAYRLFPVIFDMGKQQAFTLPPLQVQPLPDDYEFLGYDPVSRSTGNMFDESPLWSNGWWSRVKINCYCLVDDAATAFRLAQHFSEDRYNAEGFYTGPAEPGPYFVFEVLRKRRRTGGS